LKHYIGEDFVLHFVRKKMGERKLMGLELIQMIIDKVKLIKERMKEA
jgi:hypothetical protein